MTGIGNREPGIEAAAGRRGGGCLRRAALAVSLVGAGLLGAAGALLGSCGPFTDVSDPVFCPFVLEIFTLGITTGTTPTTYDPSSSVTRLQMAAFLSRTVDRVLQRASPRTSLRRFWTPQTTAALGVTTLGISDYPGAIQFDGRDLWEVNAAGNCSVNRIRASDGRILQTWTACAIDELLAMGGVFLTGVAGELYRIDPAQAPGSATLLTTVGASNVDGIAFDGLHLWTSVPNDHSVSIVTPGPWTVTTVTAGFSFPGGMLFDGSNVWVSDPPAILKLDAAGAVLQTVTLGGFPGYPVFDGTNLWVTLAGVNEVSVVRPSSGAVLATLTGNGLSLPFRAAFDGERVLVTNSNGNSVSLWKAADLTPLGSFSVGAATDPSWVCSDGVNFWISLANVQKVARF